MRYNGIQKWTGAGESIIDSGKTNTTKIISALGPTETDYAAGLVASYADGDFPNGFYRQNCTYQKWI